MFKKIFALLVMTVFLCGCIKVETDLTINNNGSAVVKERFMMSKQLLAMAGQDPFEQAIKEKQTNDREIVPYETDEMKGFEAKLVIKNLDTDKWNITQESNAIKTNNLDKKFVSVKKDFFRTIYNIDAEFDITKSSENSSDTTAQLDAMKASGMDMSNFLQYKYTIRIPKKADLHNANHVDVNNNAYIWDIKFGEINKVQMKFTIYNVTNILIVLFVVFVSCLSVVYFKTRA